MAAVEKDLDAFESWQADLFKRQDYKALNKAAYEAAVWLEENANVKDKDWNTLNNATSLLCMLSAELLNQHMKRQVRS